MAIKGKLKDLGIADALQELASKRKTGVLSIKSPAAALEISFIQGQAVRVLSRSRKSRDLLGNLLVRSGVLKPQELKSALELQARSLRRLGDILVTEGYLTSTELREMMQLQISEALFGLLELKKGSYAFVARDVEPDPALGMPISPETILEEGIRRLDEWPAIRKKIPSNHLSLIREERMALPEAKTEPADFDAAFDAVLKGEQDELDAAPRSIGDDERLVYGLVEADIAIQEVIDKSRLGEFEASKALYQLIEAGYLSVGPLARRSSEKGFLAFWRGELGRNIQRSVVQVGLGAVLVGLFALAATTLGSAPSARKVEIPTQVGNMTLKRIVSEAQLGRLELSIEAYRFKNGRYPASLDHLLEDSGLAERELRHPFRNRYHYSVGDAGYVLLPPLE